MNKKATQSVQKMLDWELKWEIKGRTKNDSVNNEASKNKNQEHLWSDDE